MRRKIRKPSPSPSQSRPQTPQIMAEKGTDLAQIGNPSSAGDGNPNFSIGKEKVLENENPDSIGEEKVLGNESPKSIEGDDVLGSENPRMGVEDDGFRSENPNSDVNGGLGLEGLGGGEPELIEEDDEEELMMIEDEKPRRVIENPSFSDGETHEQTVQNPREDDLDGEELKFFEKGGDFEHQEQRIDEAEGMSLSLSPSMNNAVENDVNMLDIVHENPIPATVTSSNVARKNPRRKRNLNVRQRAAIDKKIHSIREKLKLVPFRPSKTLDFNKHEKLLKKLGLWDFVHVEFDQEIRHDFLYELLVSYNPKTPTPRGSFIGDYKIMVSRAYLARALKLPGKRDKVSLAEGLDSDLLSEESKQFLQEFLSNWVLLHEDAWLMPSEVITSIQLIKEGQPQKIDWSGLIWFMVAKELTQATRLGSCYYASHLQCMIKHQWPVLFKEEEPLLEVSAEEGDDPIGDLKMRSIDDCQGPELGKIQTELCLGQERIGSEEEVRHEEVINFQHHKEEEPECSAEWLLDGKNNVTDHSLRPCNLNIVNGVGEQHIIKEEGEEEEEEEEGEQQISYNFSSKFHHLERLPSSDLLGAIDHQNMSFSPSVELQNHASGQFLQSRPDAHLNPGSSSMFGNSCKRELSHEDDDPHQPFHEEQKRMRHEGHWEHKTPDFDMCMEEMNSWMGKARMMYEAKDQAYLNAQMNQQILLSEMQQRNSIIANLQKTRFEEVQKRDVQIYKLERELVVMSSLLEGYRKALRENRRQFAEYRERYSMLEGSVYKDVGPGGLVLSSSEVEKLRLHQEEEERKQCLMIEEKVVDFESGWLGELKGFGAVVDTLDERLSGIENAAQLLKDNWKRAKTLEAETRLDTSMSPKVPEAEIQVNTSISPKAPEAENPLDTPKDHDISEAENIVAMDL
ncbi:hypothetical protein Sjap_000430 [Stephania japonica]|uniref:Uncharacterized protein n=1 Tax=Stephania japonica TaxID=461633 RepID=A0AAP0PSF6_9MAGN